MAKETSENDYLRGLYKAALDQKTACNKQVNIMEQLLVVQQSALKQRKLLVQEQEDHNTSQRLLVSQCKWALQILVWGLVVFPWCLFFLWLFSPFSY